MAKENIDIYGDKHPNKVPVFIFAFLFTVFTFVHLGHMIKYRGWFFIPFILGGILMSVGYHAKHMSLNDRTNFVKAAIAEIGILVAPALNAASLYMMLGRLTLMRPQKPRLTIIGRRWITAIFVIADILSFLIQAIGIGTIVSQNDLKKGEKPDEKLRKNGMKIVVLGACVQVIALLLFVLNTFIFHHREKKHYSGSSIIDPKQDHGMTKTKLFLVKNGEGADWHVLLTVMYVTSALILARSVFRAIEFLPSLADKLMEAEWALYCLDSLPMFFVMVVFAFVYPPAVLNDAKKRMQAAGMDTSA